MTGSKLVDPTSGEIPRPFLIQKIEKSPKWFQKVQGRAFSEEKKRRQAKTTTTRTGEQNVFSPRSKTYPSPSKHIQSHPNQFNPQIGLAKIKKSTTFEAKIIFSPKDDNIKKDAKVNIYPLEWNAPNLLFC